MFQPFIDVFDQPALVVVDVDTRGDVHRGNEHHPFLHAALVNDLFDLGRDVNVGPVRLCMELQVLGNCLHSVQ